MGKIYIQNSGGKKKLTQNIFIDEKYKQEIFLDKESLFLNYMDKKYVWNYFLVKNFWMKNVCKECFYFE